MDFEKSFLGDEMSKRKLKALLLPFFLCFILSGVSCEKEDITSLSSMDMMSRQDEEVCLFVNQTIAIVQEFIEQSQSGGKILAVDFGVGENMCQLVFDNGESGTMYLGVPQSRIGYPDITVKLKDDGYYWILREVGRRRIKEMAIRVGGNIPQVKYGRGVWLYRLGTETWEQIETSDTSNMQIDLFSLTGCASAVFSTGCHVDVEWERKIFMLRSDVPNESYYKDFFLDAGYGLTNRQYIAAADMLGLTVDYFSTSSESDTPLQNRLFGGDDIDINGRLLYPDGQPRYKLLFVVGGKATTHGKSLSNRSREKMRTFFLNGGSYVGTCAGSFFSSNGYNNNENYSYYLNLWPLTIRTSGVSNSVVGMRLLPDSPLLNYYSYGGDAIVSNIRHSGGSYVDRWPAGAEILAWNDSTSDSSLRGKPAIWSYKKDKESGRLVVTGSHPEGYTSGERRDLMAAMMQYAIDGRGRAIIKGILRNGETREMNMSTEDNNPNYTKIGDLQYHHFVVFIPKGAVQVEFVVTSPLECDMQLLLSRRTIPYNHNAKYSTVELGSKQLLQFHSLDSGIWYVSVKCNTTVTAATEDWGQSYSGRTDVLNGVPYSIRVSWDELRRDSSR